MTDKEKKELKVEAKSLLESFLNVIISNGNVFLLAYLLKLLYDSFVLGSVGWAISYGVIVALLYIRSYLKVYDNAKHLANRELEGKTLAILTTAHHIAVTAVYLIGIGVITIINLF